jgi:tetratricopeptide (TPR) repeat protein
MSHPVDDSAASTLPPAAVDRTAPPAFQAEELIAGRWKIVRLIDRGGMGEVYEAEDLELGERVALKTVRPLLAGRIQAIERFKRETALARKVTHPNVCRIFDIGVHRRAEGSGAGLFFLTMELLPGETLAQRLRRAGPLSEAEALPLARQLAAALDAAHAAGVIHRDFKSSNVLLVSTSEPRAAGVERRAEPEVEVSSLRAVVTDFGLACSPLGPEEADAASALVGTPDYMAPEQVEGGPITPAADLYALGVVLYETLTGRLPFGGEQRSSASMLARLHEPPVPPSAYVPGLDARWEAVLLRLLSRDPAQRPATASEAIRALDPGEARRASAQRRCCVAVLGFRNLSGRADAAWLSTALSEMLGTELAAGEQIRVIAGENVARVKAELGLTEAEDWGPETLKRVCSRLGAPLIVLGSYVALSGETGRQIRLDLRLQDVSAGETLAVVRETGFEGRLFDLVSQAGLRLREKLGLGGLSSAEAERARAAFPSRPEAARLYAEGLIRLRALDYPAARELLEGAVQADPLYPLAHAALAQAWAALGYVQKARQAAQRAIELSGSLSREERLLIEGRYHELRGELDQAIDICAALFTFFPDNLDYGLDLARTQALAGKREALDTIEALRRLPPPLSEDPRIDLEEARAAGTVAQLERMREAASRAVAKGRAQGARFIVAPARYREGVALRNLGRPKEALEAIEEAQRLFAEAGDTMGSAVALHYLARMLLSQGRLLQARSMLEQALATYRALDNAKSAAYLLSYLGMTLLGLGESARAQRLFEEELELFRQLGDPGGLAGAELDLAEVLVTQGRLEQGRLRAQAALELYRKSGKRHGEAGALFWLGHVHLCEGRLAEARQRFEEALSVWSQIGLKRYAARDRITLATLALEEGRTSEAEAFASEAAAASRALGSINEEVLAYALLAQALVAQGRVGEAREAAGRAAELAAETEKVQPRIAAALAEGRAWSCGTAAEAQRAEARLEEARHEAERAGLYALGLEAELALGQIEQGLGRIEAGRARLETLEKAAASRGFGLIARKAAAALGLQAEGSEIFLL